MHNSFDVDDLELEEQAVKDMQERHLASKAIRDEKELKRKMALSAELRRRKEYGSNRQEVAQLVRQEVDSMPVDAYDLLPIPQSDSRTTSKSGKMLPDWASPTPAYPEANSDAEEESSALADEDLSNSGVDSQSMRFFDEVIEDRYRITCPICGTIQYVEVGSVGEKAKCPDCYSSYEIPPLPSNWKPSKMLARHDHFDPNTPLAGNRELAGVDRHRKQMTSSLLERAESDLAKEKVEEDRYGAVDFDTNTFIQRTFGFLRDPVAIGFILGYSFVFALSFSLVQFGISQSSSENGKGITLFCTIVGPLIGIAFGLPLFSAALAQLEAVANRQSKVADWPGLDLFDNAGDLLCVVVALVMSAMPGYLVGFWFGGDLEGSGRIQITGTMFSILLLFPIFLLSILDNSNIMHLISRDVIRSMKEVMDAWAAYYFKSILVISLTLLIWYLLLGEGKSAWLAAAAGATVPLLVFFLFQQVGCLADLIGEHLSFSFDRSEFDEPSDRKEDLEDAVQN